jgi:hypothetical protein
LPVWKLLGVRDLKKNLNLALWKLLTVRALKKNLYLASLEIVKSSRFEEKSKSCQFGNC